MKITHYGSGSHGNAYLVDKTLIDCGLQIDYSEIDFNTVLITHAHIDHIRYLWQVLQKAESWFAPEAVFDNILEKTKRHPKKKQLHKMMYDKLKPSVPYFDLNHDVPCVGYDFGEYIHLGDTAYPNTSVIPKGKTLYTIESNYDTEMLEATDRPDFLIERIKETHLSNELAWELAQELQAKNVIYVHLSRESNSPKLARATHLSLGSVGDYPIDKKVYDIANLGALT